jgi:hypothetical protein
MHVSWGMLWRMAATEDDGLRVVSDTDSARDTAAAEDGWVTPELDGDSDLESLRDEFVDAFNSRDLEVLLTLVAPDVETPEIAGDGAAVFAEELEAIWERSPGAILTRAFLDGSPCAVAWLPDEDGCWSRAALVCFAEESSLLTVVAVPDDADALDRAEAPEPTGLELEEWSDWSEWDRGEATDAPPRHRDRP